MLSAKQSGQLAGPHRSKINLLNTRRRCRVAHAAAADSSGGTAPAITTDPSISIRFEQPDGQDSITMDCPSGEQLRYIMVDSKVDLYTTWYVLTHREQQQGSAALLGCLLPPTARAGARSGHAEAQGSVALVSFRYGRLYHWLGLCSRLPHSHRSISGR